MRLPIIFLVVFFHYHLFTYIAWHNEKSSYEVSIDGLFVSSSIQTILSSAIPSIIFRSAAVFLSTYLWCRYPRMRGDLVSLCMIFSNLDGCHASRCSRSLSLVTPRKNHHCGIGIQIDSNGVCSSFPTYGIQKKVPECDYSVARVMCYCEGDECNENEFLLVEKFREFFHINPSHNVQQCLKYLVEKKWPEAGIVPPLSYIFQCDGEDRRDVSGGNGNQCGYLLRTDSNGTCYLLPESRSRSSLDLQSICVTANQGIFCSCKTDYCNKNRTSIQTALIKYSQSHRDHSIETCRRLVTVPELIANRVTSLGPRSFQCEGGSVDYWSSAMHVCTLSLIRNTDGVCSIVKSGRKFYTLNNMDGVGCGRDEQGLTCYCDGDKCTTDHNLFLQKIDEYFLRTFVYMGIILPESDCRDQLNQMTNTPSEPQYFFCYVEIQSDHCTSKAPACLSLPTIPSFDDCIETAGVLRCFCIANNLENLCNSNPYSLVFKIRKYIRSDSIRVSKYSKCLRQLTETDWPLEEFIPEDTYIYDCDGTTADDRVSSQPNLCSLELSLNDGVCLLRPHARLRSEVSQTPSDCASTGTGVSCVCWIDRCNAMEKSFRFGAYLEKSNHPAKSCMKMITSKVMSLYQIKKINVNSYECIGDGSKFWESDNNRCGVMITKEDGECHSKQTSRSVGAGQDTPCWAEDKNVICLCSGDQCNQHQQSFLKQFEEFYMRHYRTTGKAPVPKACREMTAVYEKRHVKQEICAVALEEGSDKVCQLVKNDCFTSYLSESLDCQPANEDVRCFCEGEGCHQNPYDLVPQFDKFFADFPNHSKSGCYSKMRETTTTSSPTTTEEIIVSSTSDSHPGSGYDGSELEGEQTLTTRKDVETEKLVEDDGKDEGKEGKGTNEGSNNPLIISSSAGVIFLVVVAVIVGCCFWKRNGGNKKGKPSQEGVIEVQPKPFFGPLPLPPTPATPAPSTPAVPLTPAPSTPAVPMSPATSTPAVPMSPATPIPVVPLTPATPTPAAPLTPTAPAKAAKKRKVRAPRKLSAGEIIAKREAKRLRREELKRKAEIPIDVLSDRRFEKKGPLHFINVQRELPDDPLTVSGTMTGTGPVEFDDRGNELFYLGTDIEIIDDSIRTRPTQDEDDVEKTQSDDVEEKKKDKKKKRKKSKGTGQKRKKKRRTSKNNVSSKK